MTTELLEPRADNACFGCGGANARGLRLTFELDRETRRVRARLKLEPAFAGAGGVVHGGITALVFDEAMGKLSRLEEVRAVTAELTVNYLRPVYCDTEVVVEAWETGREGRNLMQAAELRDAGGAVLAKARGRFVAVGGRG